VRFFDQLHPQNRLLESQSAEGLQAIYDETVAPLVEHDRRRHAELRHTLEVYLAEDRSIARAAETLHMHRNTLNKRLEKIEGLLGLNLSSTDDLVALRLGLRAYEMLGGAEG
jgi:DNA-binding PucR family transcriptional regulator